MTRFVKVQGVGSYADYDVPTKEEYEDFQQNIGKQLDKLESIIEALSPRTPAGEEELEKEEVYSKNCPFETELVLTGNKHQHKEFETLLVELYHSRSWLPNRLEIVNLAFKAGLSVKKEK